MWRIGVVHHGSRSSPALAGLREGLHQRGLIDGVDYVLDAVGVAGRWERLSQVIRQLLHRGPDVIVALGAKAALQAQRATAQVPILHAIVLDAADIGLTALNVGGISTFDPGQARRHLCVLQQLVPGLRRVAVLTDPDAPQGRDGFNPLLTCFLQAATEYRLEATSVAVCRADAQLEGAVGTVRARRAQALIALEVPAVLARLGDIGRLAERHRLPLLLPHGWADTGTVMEGASLHDAIAMLSERIAALLSGACLGEGLSHTVRHHRLVIHRGRAQRIGLTVPTSLVDQATCCIDDESSHAANVGKNPAPHQPRVHIAFNATGIPTGAIGTDDSAHRRSSVPTYSTESLAS